MIPELSETVRVSRAKYPDTDLDTRIDGLVQEAGEALQALMKLKMGIGTKEHAREEVLHLAGQCVRLLEESLAPYDYLEKMAAVDREMDALERIQAARQNGITAGVKWASAHPRIHRWDFQEPVTAYIERGIQEVGG